VSEIYYFCGQEGSVPKNFEKVFVYRAELSMVIAMIALCSSTNIEIFELFPTCMKMS
jgi:hypothetical protein